VERRVCSALGGAYGKPRADGAAQMEPTVAELSPQYVLWLAILATGGLVLCWVSFWWAVVRRGGEEIRGILGSSGFFRTVAVMGVIAAATVLSLTGRLPGQITGAILSGIVGYVLGQLSGHKQAGGENREPAKEPATGA
jgi:phosphate/sulfate permease